MGLSLSESIKKMTKKTSQVATEEEKIEMSEMKKPVEVVINNRKRRISAFTIKKRSEMWDLETPKVVQKHIKISETGEEEKNKNK